MSENDNAESGKIPEASLDAITLTFGPFLRSSSQLLVTSSLSSFLTFYIARLPSYSPRHVQLAIGQLLPGLLEKLNDPKERIHSAAAACLAALGKKCYEVEGAGPGSNGVGALISRSSINHGPWPTDVLGSMS